MSGTEPGEAREPLLELPDDRVAHTNVEPGGGVLIETENPRDLGLHGGHAAITVDSALDGVTVLAQHNARVTGEVVAAEGQAHQAIPRARLGRSESETGRSLQ